jgi:hypothetical protein
MPKVTPEEITIIKRIAAIESISHKVEPRWNAETDQDEDYDCFYSRVRGESFEWCSRYDSFEDFIRDYAQFKYECGYQTAASW